MGAVVGNVFYNTESGLTPTLDRLTSMLDQNAQERQKLAGLAPALAGMGIPVSQPQGAFGGILSALGIGATPSQTAQPAPQTAPTSAPVSAPSGYRGPAPGFDNAVTRTLGFEGGLNPKDTNGTPSNFGINQKANPGVDVASLTPEAARGIYKTNYWDAIGADNLPPALSRAAFDTAVIAGPGKAKELLAASGGDPMKLMDLREQFQRELVQADPQKYGPYAKAWAARNNGLRIDIAALNAGAGGAPSPAMAFAPQGGGAADAPGSQAIAGSLPPGFTQAGADVAAAGLRGRAAAGYPAPPTGADVGAQTAAATGTAPMPIATSAPHITPTMQGGAGADPSAVKPSLQLGAGPMPPGGISKEALGAMISNPASQQIGLQLWQQMLGKQDFGFMATPAGDIIRTDQRTGQAQLVFRAPVKHEVKDFNGRLVDFDPQSSATRDVTPVGMPTGYRPATPQERADYGVQDGAAFFFGPDNKPATLNSGNNTTINTGADPVMGAVGKRFDNSLQAADNAAKTIVSLRAARQQLNAPGGIFAGALAGEKLSLQKLAVAIGLPGADAQKITNTESFNTAVGPLVLQTVKGFGAGASISNADRDAAERMVGSKSLEPASIALAFDIQEKAAKATIDQHNALVDQLQKSPSGGVAYRNIGPGMRVTVPEAPAAASGQPVRVSTPEEAMRLPPGTMFIDPNGQPRMRP